MSLWITKAFGLNPSTPFFPWPNVSRAMVMWPPCRKMTDWLTDLSLNRQEHKCPSPAKGRAPPLAMNGMFCKRCGVGKIYRHYGVGHGSLPCWPLFFYISHMTHDMWHMTCYRLWEVLLLKIIYMFSKANYLRKTCYNSCICIYIMRNIRVIACAFLFEQTP